MSVLSNITDHNMTQRGSILTIILLAAALSLAARDYNASMFGVKSDGTTLNTTSIQKAIVLDDVHDAAFSGLKVNGPGAGKDTVYIYKSTEIKL